MDLLDPATAVGLNGILDGASLCLPMNGGEVIPPHPMFRFVATANTNGGSDDSGLYQSTLRQNLAFMDRFRLCEIGYPEPEAELRILVRAAPDLPDGLRKTMVDYALDRALAYRAGNTTRALLHELTQRMFGGDPPTDDQNVND